jgi:hypothetical protein
MQTCVIQDRDFRGNIELSSQSRRSFYRYSLWRAQTGEHIFDGAAGDRDEALDTMRAHIRYMAAGERMAARE